MWLNSYFPNPVRPLRGFSCGEYVEIGGGAVVVARGFLCCALGFSRGWAGLWRPWVYNRRSGLESQLAIQLSYIGVLSSRGPK